EKGESADARVWECEHPPRSLHRRLTHGRRKLALPFAHVPRRRPGSRLFISSSPFPVGGSATQSPFDVTNLLRDGFRIRLRIYSTWLYSISECTISLRRIHEGCARRETWR